MGRTTRTGDKRKATAQKVAAAKKKAKESNAKPAAKLTKKEVDKLPVKYWAFEMDQPTPDGLPVYFEDAAEAQEFRKDYKDIIAGEKRFRLKDKFLDYQAQQIDGVKNGRKVVTPKRAKKQVALDNNSAQKLKDMVANTMPRDEIVVSVNTTISSPVCNMMMQFKDNRGEQTWVVKPSIVAHCLNSWAKVLPNSDKYIQEAMLAMEGMLMRDPNSRDTDKPLIVQGKPRDDGSKGKGFEVELLVTQFTIPYRRFKNEKAEASWMQDTAKIIASEVRNIMLLPDFIDALKIRTPWENYYKAIMKDPANYVNYPQFLKQAVIRTQVVDTFANMLIRSDAQVVATRTWKSRLNKRKYTTKKDTPVKKKLVIDLSDDSDDDIDVQYDEPDDDDEQQDNESEEEEAEDEEEEKEEDEEDEDNAEDDNVNKQEEHSETKDSNTNEDSVDGKKE